MALVAVKPSGTPLKWCLLSFLAVLVNLGGGATSPLRSQFRVYGLDTVRVGQATFLNCHLEGSDTGTVTRPPSYVWVKDGKVIPGQTDMFLRFKGVTREDAGLYQCGAPGSDVGGEGRRLHVVVLGDILPKPSIDYRDDPVCGRPYSLRCIFLEKYIPSVNTVYTWYKDHTEVKGQSGQTLNFPNVKETDRGEYMCTGREGGWETTSPPSQEYLMEPLVIPQVTIEVPSTDSVAKGILGENLTLTARVIRALPQVPHDGYSWSFLPFPQEQLRPLEGRESTLTLGPLTLEDRGQYFCQARNDQGNRDLRLIGNASVTVDVVYLKGMTLTPDVEVNEGDPVTLTCGVDSHPTAHLVWTLNGREVRHVTYNVDHYIISSAACSDSNNYTCGASNPDLPGLEIKATVQLTVLCKQATTEAHTTVSPITTTDFTPELADTNSGPWRVMATVSTAILGIILVTVAVLVLLWHRLTHSQRRKFLTRVFDYFCPVEAEGTEFHFSMEGQTVMDMESLSDQESTTSDEFSHLLEDYQGADQASSTPSEGTELRRRRGETWAIPFTSSSFPLSKIETRNINKLWQTPLSYWRRTAPTPQGQKVHFDAVYQKGAVHVLPPLQDSTTQQSAGGEGGHALREEEDLRKMQSEVTVIRRLYQALSKTVCPDDPPVFLFTQSLPCDMDAIIYHKVYGAIIVKVNTLESVDAASRSLLKKTGKNLQDARRRLQEELQGQLHSDGVTLLLALPNLEDNGNLSERKDWLQKKDVQHLVGRTEAEYLAWLQTLATKKHTEPWGSGGNSDKAFRTAVRKYLCMMSYGDGDDPLRWLATPEQASVLRCTDKLLHVWGPPGSGKTLLLLDRVRRWLLKGKTVVLAVWSPSCELLLHRLGRAAVNKLSNDTANRLSLCSNLEELRKTIDVLRQKNQAASVCMAIDAIETDFHNVLMDTCRSSTVECAWTTSRADLPNLGEFHKLGGRSVCLSHSLRCTASTLELARKLLPPEAKVASWTELPGRPASSPSAVNVERHPSHPGSKAGASPSFDCSNCNAWLRESLSPLKGLPLDDEKWKRWVALLTGDWSSDSQLTEKLVSWLRRQGVPAVHERELDKCVSNPSVSRSRIRGKRSQKTHDRATTRARVESSVDKARRPAVHVMRGSLFRGLEKPCVLVVHYDWRDDHPDHQSQERRNSRQSQHQGHLFHAVTSCRGQLAVLLLSPSPAASLLPHHA